MGFIASGAGVAGIVGAVLLAIAILYALARNRATSDRDRARTEEATRDLYRAEGDAEETREANRPPR